MHYVLPRGGAYQLEIIIVLIIARAWLGAQDYTETPCREYPKIIGDNRKTRPLWKIVLRFAMAYNSAVEGGYDYDFVDSPPDRLVCKICQSPYREVQRCGHVFCILKCCKKLRSSTTSTIGQACPTCRKESFNAFVHLEADHKIEVRKVCCPNVKDGRGWIGEFIYIANIVGHKPPQKCKRCDKCDNIIHYSVTTSHLPNNCPCYCPHCDITADREVISSKHKNKCHRFPLTCPNNCGWNDIPRESMNDHKKVCPLEVIQCKYHCGARIARNEVEKHNQEKITEHIQLARNVLSELEAAQSVEMNKAVYNIATSPITGTSHFTIVVTVLVIIVALLLQPYYMVTTGHNLRLTDEELTKARSHIVQLQNDNDDLKAKETEHLEKLAQSESLVNQLQNDNDDLKAKETEHLKKLAQSESLVNQLQSDTNDLKAKHSEKLSKSANCKSDKLAQTESKLKQLSKSVYISYNSNHGDGSLWPLILIMSNEMSDQVAPAAILKLSNFAKMKKNKEIWHSNSFFAFQGGYKMRLRVSAAGSNDGEGTHVSVYLHLMKGPHDDKLEQSGHWPLRGTFTIELLNQLSDNNHHSHVVQSHHYLCSECTNRVSKGLMANGGLGTPRFISHETLLHHNSSGYHTNDSLMFRVSYEDVEPPYRVAPVTFKVIHFLSQWLKNKGTWYSSPFLAFYGGYQMFLMVNGGGDGDGEGTHVSVYVYLMKGPHDDKLNQSGHWPLRGRFTIELLNQLNNNDHYSRKVIFTRSDAENRVVDGIYAPNGWGYSQFISHDILLHHKYLKNDVLYFRISYQDTDLGGISALPIVVSILIMICGLFLLFSLLLKT